MIVTLVAITAVCIVALVLVRTWLRHHPSGRYFVCLAALILALLTPVLVALRQATSFGLITLTLPREAVETDSTRVATPPASQGDWLLWSVGVIWALGVLVGVYRFVSGWSQVARLKRGATPIGVPADVRASVESILKRALPPIYASSQVASPVAVGLFRPIVILPAGWIESLSPLARRQILLHESAHIALGHILGGAIERLAGIVLWPHLLVGLLRRELARAREEVCDNVASQEAGAACYARTLLLLAQGLSPAPTHASALALLGPETSLEARITGLLNPRRDRMIRVSQGKLWASGLAVCALVATVAVRVVAAEPNSKNAAAHKNQAEKITRVQTKDGKLTVVTPDGKKAGVITPTRKTLYRVKLDNVTQADMLRAKLKAEAEAKASGVSAPGRWVMLKEGLSPAARQAAKKRVEGKYHWKVINDK